MIIKLLLISFFYISSTLQQNTNKLDKLTIRYIKNDKIGLHVSIPNDEGLKFFAFHGAINRFIKPNEIGDFNGIVFKSTNGFYTYLKEDIQLKDNDILYYWYHWQINNLQYNSLEEHIAADKISYPLNPAACIKSHTIINRKILNNCNGTLIFDESFENFNTSLWKYEIKIPSEDFAFVSYQNREENIFIKDGILNILPTTPYDDVEIKSLNQPWVLPKCTGIPEYEECERVTSFNKIVPPVVTAKILSRFSFTYGRIEVRAKLPIGDWIIPQILLEPRDYYYSNKEYSSGQMKIAYTRGNLDLKDKYNQTNILDGRVLYGGAILEPLGAERRFLKKIMNEKHFGEEFHVYSLVWTKSDIKLYVDNTMYGIVKGGFKDDQILLRMKDNKRIGLWKTSGNLMAPFDREFVVSLGLSVGGLSDFPDHVINRNKFEKPWSNTSPIPEISFYKHKPDWKSTWNDSLSALKVDYVRVYSV